MPVSAVNSQLRMPALTRYRRGRPVSPALSVPGISLQIASTGLMHISPVSQPTHSPHRVLLSPTSTIPITLHQTQAMQVAPALSEITREHRLSPILFTQGM